MAEVWDVYDEWGEKTGETMKRGIPLSGQYYLCVHIYLYTPEKKFLVQKRSRQKESHPGVWDITGGAVLSGENSMEGARRETLEEVGIDISDGKIQYITRIKQDKYFADVYFVEQDFSIADCRVQKEEVEAVRLVSAQELLYLQQYHRLRRKEYMQIINQAVREIECEKQL
ncbi:MAG: NUDIX domain-containing protein [Clostridiaceae bacterium]|nr:NUDIX domain-containing protein [Clostridiaceae bacterium]